jgi:hypothetical protein
LKGAVHTPELGPKKLLQTEVLQTIFTLQIQKPQSVLSGINLPCHSGKSFRYHFRYIMEKNAISGNQITSALSIFSITLALSVKASTIFR